MDTVDVGPVDVLLLRVPGNQFKGEILPAMREPRVAMKQPRVLLPALVRQVLICRCG